MAKDAGTTLHERAIIIDGLNVSHWCQETFRQIWQGGLTAINATVAVHEGFRETIGHIADWTLWFAEYEQWLMPARSFADIRRAKEAGRVGVIFGFQSTDPTEKDLRLLSIFHELGVRIVQITYNERNYVGDGCFEETDCGLSHFGREVIEELNRLGVLIDLSHVGYRTTMETIEASSQPVAFTHANPRALCDHVRNKTDEQLLAVARKGGVIGANIYPPFLAAGSEAKMSDFIDVIDYMVRLVGIDHVGIGTDFTAGQTEAWFHWLRLGKSRRRALMQSDWPLVYPEGIRSAAEFPNITRALLARGYTEAHTRQIMGENFLRLFETVWAE